MANSIQYDYKILDRYSGPLSKIKQVTDKFSESAKKMKQAVSKSTTQMKKWGESMATAENAIASVGISAAIKSLLDDSLSMENAIADIGKVSDMSKDQLAGVRVELEGLSEKIGRPAEALAKIAFEGKKLGTTDKDLMPFVNTVAKMAVAFDMTEESAGAAIGSIKAKLGLSMDEVIKFGDAANHLANTMATSGENIIEIVQRTSGTMKTLKVPPEVSAGFAAFADQVEVSAELGASGLNMMLNRMMVMPGMMDKLMKDPVSGVRDEMAKLAKMPEAQRAKVIFKKFGQESGRFVLKLTSNMELFDKTMKTALSKETFGSMTKEMQNTLERTSTMINIAKEKTKNSLRKLGDALAPIILIIANVFGAFAKWFGEFSKAHPKFTKFTAIAMIFVAVFGSMLVVIGMVVSAIAALSTPILIGASAVMGAITAFSLWIKTGNPLIDRLRQIGSLVWDTVSSLMSLIGIGDSGSTIMILLGQAFDVIGIAISLALIPLQMFLVGLNTIVKVATNLINMDFGAALETLRGGFSQLTSTFGIGDETSKAASGASESAAKTKATQQNVNVGGTIKVAAEQGTKVTSATPDLNTGVNMGMAY